MDKEDKGKQSTELVHISASYLIMAFFYGLFVFDAILKENFMELIAAAVISVIFTARLGHYLVSFTCFFDSCETTLPYCCGVFRAMNACVMGSRFLVKSTQIDEVVVLLFTMSMHT